MGEGSWGYFCVSRKMTDSGDHFLWDSDDPFCPRSAWIDCIARAAYKVHRKKVGNTAVTIPRGCFLASLRTLAKDWRWSKRRVRSYLDLLIEENMIEGLETHRSGTVYRVVNYGTYQYSRDRHGDATGTQPGRNRDNKNKREVKINKEKILNTGAREESDEPETELSDGDSYTDTQKHQALMDRWLGKIDVRPDSRTISRNAKVASRLAENCTAEQLSAAVHGIEKLYPHSSGEPWDLFDLERKMGKAIEASGTKRLSKKDRNVRETLKNLEEFRREREGKA